MRARAAALCAALAACDGGGELLFDGRPAARPSPPPAVEARPQAAWYECQGSPQAFVRRAFSSLLGRRPRGQAEVLFWVDLLAALAAHDGPAGPAGPLGAPLPRSRQILVEALATDPDYAPRWLDFYRDHLRVQRLAEQANPGCYGASLRGGDPALAAAVRDLPSTSTVEGGAFTMHDLLEASIAVDDLSPVFTANLFPMLSRSFSGANSDPVRRELARRGEFGAWFGASYLRRDGVCIGCHNGEFSVTYSEDPATNRFFALPGRLEQSLFGSSSGPEPQGDHDSSTRIHAVLRYDGLADASNGLFPWGMAPSCGSFTPQEALTDDPAGVDARFGPVTGLRASVWGLSASLQRGFQKLRAHGLSRGAGGLIPDPDEAFAYLVSASAAEQVWREVIGTPLTIAHDFPRNAAARDQLLTLTEGFISSGFSHRALLQLTLQSPAFNLLPPSAGCGASPYPMPPLFDPWSTAASDPALRGNGPGDGLASLSSRTMLRAARGALGWGHLYDDPFPASRESVEADFQAEIGVFLRNVEPGFRGFDFQALLAWEGHVGSCEKPPGVEGDDFIDELLREAAARPDSTAADLALALKDRLLGEPAFSTDDEMKALSAILGPLDAPASSLGAEAPAALRSACGAMLASAPFLLQGLAPPDSSAIPALTPPSARYRAACQRVADRGLPRGLSLVCGESSLSIAGL